MSPAAGPESSPVRGPRRGRAPSELRVAAVLDEASAAGLAPECELLEIGSDTWRAELEERAPDLLLVESAWAGTSGSWQYQVATYDHPDSAGLPALRALVDWCRQRDVPTAFWGHAHPQDVARFTEAARLFDHVFTSRPETASEYGAARAGRGPLVHALPCAVQPLIHNPILPRAERASAPCYAGSYRRGRPPDELRALDEMLDGNLDLGLRIYDPCAGSPDEATNFPERFHEHLAGRVPYERTGAMYKAHRVSLVAGFPASSPAVPRGILEAAACDTAVVSAPGAGIQGTFGDVVTTVEPSRAADAVAELLDDGDRRARITVAARRLVLSGHTYRSRLATLANAAGLRVAPDATFEVAALVLVEDLEQLGRLWWLMEATAEQSRPPAEVLVGLARDTPIDAELDPLARRAVRGRVVRQDRSAPSSERHAELAALATSPWVAPLDTASAYGPHHLTDLVGAAQFTQADVIGTPIRGDGRRPADRDRFVEAVHPHSALVRRERVAALGWSDDVAGAAADLADAVAQGARCYSTGGYSFKAPVAAAAGGRAAARPSPPLGPGA